jgi:plasmid segregation protein ParM
MIIGIDAGNYDTKVAVENGVHKFRSLLGEYRERNFDSTFGDDMVYEYNGMRGLAGDIVEYECEFKRERYGDTKAHEDAKLRILLAIHKYGGDDGHFDIVVGQPISTHTPEHKGRIKRMLIGKHTLTVNGELKTFEIGNVNVAAEGAVAYWAYEGLEQAIRFIDIGSGTINFATVVKGRFVDRDSFTFNTGVNSARSFDYGSMAGAIIAETSKWGRSDCVRICGGIAEEITPLLARHYENCEVIKPWGLAPVYTNAIGCFELARVLYGTRK